MIKTFKNYDINFNKHTWQVKAIRLFGKSRYRQLVIFGESGRGKTHLMQAILNGTGTYEKGFRSVKKVRFVRAEEFYFLILRSAFGMEVNDFFCPDFSFDDMMESRVIIIDDLGKEKKESKDKENFVTAFKLLLDKYKGKVIITTNMNKKSILDRYGEFIHNRIFDKNITLKILLTGKDYRKTNNIKREVKL